jgi:hypothetical protein
VFSEGEQNIGIIDAGQPERFFNIGSPVGEHPDQKDGQITNRAFLIGGEPGFNKYYVPCAGRPARSSG